jgi:hypothetical protein
MAGIYHAWYKPYSMGLCVTPKIPFQNDQQNTVNAHKKQLHFKVHHYIQAESIGIQLIVFIVLTNVTSKCQ